MVGARASSIEQSLEREHSIFPLACLLACLLVSASCPRWLGKNHPPSPGMPACFLSSYC